MVPPTALELWGMSTASLFCCWMVIGGCDGAELNDPFTAVLLHAKALLLMIAKDQIVLTGSEFLVSTV